MHAFLERHALAYLTRRGKLPRPHVYNVTVNNDGRLDGEQIVQAIARYQRKTGRKVGLA